MASYNIQPSKRGTNPDRLTDKQQVFVVEYLRDNEMNARKAAEKAGYKGAASAWKLLGTPTVAKAIGKAIYERIHECKIEAAQVLRQLSAALYLDPLELFEDNGDGTFKVRSLSEVPPHIRRCITKLKCKTRTYETKDGEVTTETYVEVELMSKDAALSLAMRHLGLIEDSRSKGAGGEPVTIDLIMNLLASVEERTNVIDGTVIERTAEKL